MENLDWDCFYQDGKDLKLPVHPGSGTDPECDIPKICAQAPHRFGNFGASLTTWTRTNYPLSQIPAIPSTDPCPQVLHPHGNGNGNALGSLWGFSSQVLPCLAQIPTLEQVPEG